MLYVERLKQYLYFDPKYDESLIIRDVPYYSGYGAHRKNKLDIFLPVPKINVTTPTTNEQPTTRKGIPIIVHIHGGGWIRGSRTDEWRGAPVVGRECSREGFLGVAASYRLARISLLSFIAWALSFGSIIIIVGIGLLSWQLIVGYVVFMAFAYAINLCRVRRLVSVEDMVDDLCHILIYIRDHINEHCQDADPTNIFISGHSAGAHLISLLVLDKSHLNRHGLSLSSIRGVIPISGIYNLINPTHESKNHIRNWIFRIFYSSSLIYPKGKNALNYSPIEYIKSDEDLPPFLVISARMDMYLDVDARRFVDVLRNNQHSVEYFVVRGTHGTIINKFSKNDARKHFFYFIRQHMKY